jgi:replicative DNA helicase
MSGKLIAKRLLFSDAKINPTRVRTTGIEDYEWDQLGKSFGVLDKVPIWIDDSARNPAMVRARALRLKEQHGLGLVIVDYLQLMSLEGQYDSRAREVGKMSGDLKNLAMELDIPVIALSQFSRAVVQRKDKRPILSDLKESGQIENDSDVVLFLYREDGIIGTRTELIVAKNRSGPSGMIYLDFDKETTTFNNAKEIEQ